MKTGLSQWNKPTPKKVRLIFDILSYLLAGVAVTSWVQASPNFSIIILLIAGGIDKFVPRFFGEGE